MKDLENAVRELVIENIHRDNEIANLKDRCARLELKLRGVHEEGKLIEIISTEYYKDHYIRIEKRDISKDYHGQTAIVKNKYDNCDVWIETLCTKLEPKMSENIDVCSNCGAELVHDGVECMYCPNCGKVCVWDE